MPVNSFVKLMFIIKNSNVNDLFANKMALKQTNKQQKKTSTGKVKIVTTLAHTVYDVFFFLVYDKHELFSLIPLLAK